MFTSAERDVGVNDSNYRLFIIMGNGKQLTCVKRGMVKSMISYL